jgi:hypothetical protein
MISVTRQFVFSLVLLGFSASQGMAQSEVNQFARGFRLSMYAGIPLADPFDSHIGNYEIEGAYFPHFGMAIGKNTPIFRSYYVYAGLDFGMNMFSFRFQYDMTKYPALNANPISSNDFTTEFIPHVGPRIALGRILKKPSGVYFGEIGYTFNFYPDMTTEFGYYVASNDTTRLPNGETRSVEILDLRMETVRQFDMFIQSMDVTVGRLFFLGPRTRMQVGAIAHFCFTRVAQGSYLVMNGTPDAKTGFFTLRGNFIGLSTSLLIGSKSSVPPPEE